MSLISALIAVPASTIRDGCRSLPSARAGADRGQLQQSPTGVPASVLEQPDRPVGTLLGLADTLAHRPLIALACVGAVHVYANQRLAGQAADEEIAFPLRPELAGVDHQAARRDDGIPAHLGLLEL